MKPLFRWAGSKARLCDELARRIPTTMRTYHEPFCGSGALFFHAADGRSMPARLSDANRALTRTLDALKRCDGHGWLMLDELLDRYARKHSTKSYREAAKLLGEIGDGEELQHAARFLYVIGTNFNGLWRENRAGTYNVPCGRKSFGFDVAELRRAAALLEHATITHASWHDAVGAVERGDFVYFDPPYFGAHSTYTRQPFTLRDHARLAEWVHSAREVSVLVSLPDSWITRDFYRGLRIERVSVRRSISADAKTRSDVGELLIRNY